MKTVAATFTGPSGTALLHLEFTTLPGSSAARWNAPADFFQVPPPSVFYAETYERSLQQFANVNGWTVKIEAHGAWEVFTE